MKHSTKRQSTQIEVLRKKTKETIGKTVPGDSTDAQWLNTNGLNEWINNLSPINSNN